MQSGVYLVKCVANGRCYVGSSKDIDFRWREHKARLNGKKHHNDHWQKAWNKYGARAFEWNVLEIVEPNDELLRRREQHWIDILKPQFNVSAFAFPTRLGAMNGKLHRQRISEGQRKKWASLSEDERTERMEVIKHIGVENAERFKRQFGLQREQRAKEKEAKRLEKERIKQEREQKKEQRRIELESTREQRRETWIQRLRESILKKWQDPEYRAKHQAATQKAMQDPEVLARLSESHKGMVLSEEQRKKIGDAHRGRKRPPETGRKISAAKMGHVVSEETRRKISETKRKQHQ